MKMIKYFWFNKFLCVFTLLVITGYNVEEFAAVQMRVEIEKEMKGDVGEVMKEVRLCF